MSRKIIALLIMTTMFLVGCDKKPSVIGKWQGGNKANTVLVLQEDGKYLGSYDTTIEAPREKGNWVLSEDGKNLSITDSTRPEKPMVRQVSKLTSDAMILSEDRNALAFFRPEAFSAEVKESLILGKWLVKMEGKEKGEIDFTLQFKNDGVLELEHAQLADTGTGTWKLNKDDRTMDMQQTLLTENKMQKWEIGGFTPEVMTIRQRFESGVPQDYMPLVKTD
jgi:hypothetical protein